MAETSRGRVTITLGRSGQVVKRAAAVSDVDYDGSVSGVGSRRSVRDRLGNADSSLLYGSHGNKRQRGDNVMLSRGSNDGGIGRDDLRFKLLKKSASRRAKSDEGEKVVDLRDKLEKAVHPPAATRDRQQHMLERKENGFSGRIPLSRSVNDVQQKDSLRSSYSSWSLDPLRRRSPVHYTSSSRVLSPERNEEEIVRRPIPRTPDDIRTAPYIRKELPEVSRPIRAAMAPYRTSSTPSLPSARPPVPPLGQPPGPSPSNGITQRSLKMIDDRQNVDGLLHSLGLGKYAIIFKAEEVDMTALRQMGENDLKELGIPMGPRKKILLALLPRSKRQP